MRQTSFNFDDFDQAKGFDSKPDFFNTKKEPEPAAQEEAPLASPEPAQKKTPARKKAEKPAVLTVSQLNRSIKFALSDMFPGKITIEGEISNYKQHGSGHMYLSLKDEYSSIAAVMWRTSAGKLKFEPENGMAVVAVGKLEVYEPQGKYQLILDKLEPAGVGALELAFRQLAEKLESEGLFAKERKKTLPPFPMTIGIITSQTGAAVKDICQTLARRWPFARKILYPVTVQGTGSSQEIAAAIKDINRRNKTLGIDVLIVGRGGGSLEDLWAFNEEPVARAIVNSDIPIISGVGHEIDTTIADMVADVRAATPTAAAEIAVPVADELLDMFNEYARVLKFDLKALIAKEKDSLNALTGRPFFARPMSMLDIPRQQLDELQMQMQYKVTNYLNRCRNDFSRYQIALKKIEPHTRINALKIELENCRHKMTYRINAAVNTGKYGNETLLTRLKASTPQKKITAEMESLDRLKDRLAKSIRQIHREQDRTLEQFRKLLNNLDHRQVLKRGYSVTRTKDNDKILTDTASVKKGDILLTELADGTIESKVN